MFNWINIELINHCNKACSFCGRAEARKNGEMELGFIDLSLFKKIIKQYEGEIVQFNKDGEPLLYPHLKDVGKICRDKITNIVTNGILLWEKRYDLKDNFTSVTVSVFEDDREQFEAVQNFIRFIGDDASPRTLVKFVGDYYNPEYEKLGCRILKRTLHKPEGDTGYEASKPPIPEIGVCLDFINKPSINWRGDFHICNRYDPDGRGIIGNVSRVSLKKLWNNVRRKAWLKSHKEGRRYDIPLCGTCEFWGIPTNG